MMDVTSSTSNFVSLIPIEGVEDLSQDSFSLDLSSLCTEDEPKPVRQDNRQSDCCLGEYSYDDLCWAYCKPELVVPEIKTRFRSPYLSTAGEINKLLLSGAIVDGVRYSFSGNVVEQPEYVSNSTIEAVAYSPFTTNNPIILPKWNGITETVFVLRDEKQEKRFLKVTQGYCYFVDECGPYVGERVGNDLIAFDGVADVHTAPVESLDKRDSRTDGFIIRYENTEYRVKDERTFDLQASPKGFLNTLGCLEIVPALTNVPIVTGKIYEVTEKGVIIRERTDKNSAQSHHQCSVIRQGLTSSEFSKIASTIKPGYSVQYHISLYVKFLYDSGLLHTAISKNAVVQALSALGPPYSYDEITLYSNQLVTAAAGRPWTFIVSNDDVMFHSSDNVFQVYIREKRNLSVGSFLKFRKLWELHSFSAIKRALFMAGFAFTTPDLCLLFRRFIIRFNDKHYFLNNNDCVQYLHPLNPCFSLDKSPPVDLDKLLPFHKAFFVKGFFTRYKYFKITTERHELPQLILRRSRDNQSLQIRSTLDMLWEKTGSDNLLPLRLAATKLKMSIGLLRTLLSGVSYCVIKGDYIVMIEHLQD